MIILYRPADGGEEQHFDMRRVRTSEAAVVQKATDMKWGEIKVGVREDDPTSLRGIVWILKKREQPNLRWSDFDPENDELTSRFDTREVALYVAEILSLPEEKRASAADELKAWALNPADVDAALAEAAAPPKEATTMETSKADD
ncbi:hypothetical protein [Streptomyces sp. NRRL F-2664]|uniref:hypothetical protein n=1 Tax=Streptomyces sp. NRRL F-2664 TaxID=1463842 RepID=UPI0004C8C3E9|nr:hypothetical protein [Streptomyces sp. NRRL F-2664]